MHVLGLLFLCLILGSVLSLGDVVGAWLFDRKRGAR